METQVKERLTGAVILVALIVLLVPELLTGGPGSSSTSQPEAVQAAAEPAMRTVHIDLVDGGVRQAQPAEADLNARALPRPAPDPQSNVATAGNAAAAKGEGDAPPAQAPDASMSSGLSAAVARPVGEAPATERPAPAVVKPAPKAAEAPAAQPSKLAASGAGKSAWAVQLGSFSSRDNAQRLAKQLKGKGYSAYVLGGGGSSGKLYRVRVGPTPDKPAASALAAKLRAAGHAGSVVAQ